MKNVNTMKEECLSQRLLGQYCPNIYSLLLKAGNVNWNKQDQELNEQRMTGGKFRTSLLGLAYFAHEGNAFAQDFLKYCDSLVQEYAHLLDDKKVKNSAGIFTNFKRLNYLNLIGEFAIVDKMLKAGENLVAIEDKSELPEFQRNGEIQGIDFVFIQSSGRKLAIEVVNVHNTDDCLGFENVKKDIIEKLQKKIDEKTGGVSKQNSNVSYAIAPILWTTELHEFREHKSFFQDVASTFGASLKMNPTVPILGINGFCRMQGSGEFMFGEISSMLKSFDFSH